MKTFNIFLLELKKNISNIKIYVFIYFIAPFLISYGYGIMYQNVFDPSRQLPKFSISIINKDTGEYSKPISSLFNDKSISKIVNLKDVKDEADANKKLIDGSISAKIVIPENFSESILNGKKVSVKIVKSPTHDATAQIVADITKTYIDNTNIYYSVNSSIYKSLSDKQKAAMLIAKIQPEINSILNKNYVSEETIEKAKHLSSKQFYAESMLIMFNLFFITAGATSILKEKESGTLSRLNSTSTGKLSIIIGKFACTFLISFLQAVTFITLTSVISKVSWGDNLLYILSLVFAQCFFVSCIAMMFGSIFKTQKGMSSIATIIIMAMSFFSGSFYPTDSYPKILKTILYFTVNYWFAKGYSNAALGLQLKDTFISLLIMILIGISAIAVGYINFKFDKSEVA